MGDYAGAEVLLRSTLAAAEEMGLHETIAAIQHNLGHALARAGKLDEATALEHVALRLFQQMGIVRQQGNAGIYLAQIAILVGDFALAEREARAAADILHDAAPYLHPLAVAVIAQALLGLGRPNEALVAARDARAAMETLDSVEEGEGLIHLIYAESLHAAGHDAAAAQAIAVAEAALVARAAKISDPEWRDSFLRNVPEHARTLALARRWLGR